MLSVRSDPQCFGNVMPFLVSALHLSRGAMLRKLGAGETQFSIWYIQVRAYLSMPQLHVVTVSPATCALQDLMRPPGHSPWLTSSEQCKTSGLPRFCSLDCAEDPHRTSQHSVHKHSCKVDVRYAQGKDSVDANLPPADAGAGICDYCACTTVCINGS